jgi:hypothetical protein
VDSKMAAAMMPAPINTDIEFPERSDVTARGAWYWLGFFGDWNKAGLLRCRCFLYFFLANRSS